MDIFLGQRLRHEAQLNKGPETDREKKIQSLVHIGKDPAERADIYHQIAKVESDDLYWIPMYGTTGVAGISSRVQDFTCDFRGITFQIEKWNVTD